MLHFITKRPSHAAAACIVHIDLITTHTQQLNGGVRATGQTIRSQSFSTLMTVRLKLYFLFFLFRMVLLLQSAYAQSSKLTRSPKIFVQQPGSSDARSDLILTVTDQIQIVMLERINFRRLNSDDDRFTLRVKLIQLIKHFFSVTLRRFEKTLREQ